MEFRSENSALLIIDIQNDFCPGGSLEIDNGDKIISSINKLQLDFNQIIVTQDWHPKNHKCFAKNHGAEEYSKKNFFYGIQVLWPEHCIQGTKGANFHRDLNTDRSNLILRKGTDLEIDSYSAFFENDKKTSTGLFGYLTNKDIKTVYLCGLAFDFCVLYTALDAVRLNLNVFVFENLTKSIDLNNSAKDAKNMMLENNIKLINY